MHKSCGRGVQLPPVQSKAAMGKLDELKVWMARGVDNGITLDELRGLVVQVTFYAGWPAGLCAGKAALDLFEAEKQQ